ncbi:MAG: cupin domain-containing protein, partial [Spirochaetes bacterium]|nr:cupin domain-containing protein [Spirochaetota bacterium]
MDRDARYWITHLGLSPHPEGGHYREIYRSAGHIPRAALPDRYGGDRNYATSIYYLLESGVPSRIHRLKSDEILVFHDGSPLEVVMIDGAGVVSRHLLGLRFERGEVPQAVIPAGIWFGARVADERSFTLIGCVVAPGFVYPDLEMPGKEELMELFPEHGEIIA